jgi:hypothetical protein
MNIEAEHILSFFIILRMLVNLARALLAEPAGQSSLDKTLATLIGGVLTCCGSVWMQFHFRHLPADLPTEVRSFFVSLAKKAMAHYAPVIMRMLRDRAAKFHRLAAAEMDPDGDRFVRVKYKVLRCFTYLLVGVVDAAQSLVSMMRW